MPVEVKSELGANVWKVLVSPGQKVAADDTLVILESMKMEIPVTAPVAGTVAQVLVNEGGSVDEDAVLVVLDG